MSVDNFKNYLNDLYQSKLLLEDLLVLFVLLLVYEIFILFLFIKIYLNIVSINKIVKENKSPYNLRKRKSI
jgi:hypothetical protein